ncbi:hypothetical protein FNV43_RR05627 [Rhamnella rubrinervis]|uniref:Uncharacterized protein n=1 Tax=Rhamnella rubrinervis TaxID=2594499 RepID=A0A8K0MRA2_9ROSA|nr:hypothetical protein FNV43_RR05627 [Rhamnella rubrinervis]
MRNWTYYELNELEHIFSGHGFKVVRIMVLTVHAMPLVATVYHTGVRKPSDITPIVEDKLDVDVDTNRLIGESLDEDDVQYFDEVGGEDVGVGDAHRTCDQRIDHAANDLVPPVSISSSPIVEFEHNMKIFIQMSNRKLAGC